MATGYPGCVSHGAENAHNMNYVGNAFVSEQLRIEHGLNFLSLSLSLFSLSVCSIAHLVQWTTDCDVLDIGSLSTPRSVFRTVGVVITLCSTLIHSFAGSSADPADGANPLPHQEIISSSRPMQRQYLVEWNILKHYKEPKTSSNVGRKDSLFSAIL